MLDEVTAQGDGDYFGPVVNLAARALTLAEPRELVTDRSTSDRLDASAFVATPIGQHTLKGFEHHIELLRVERASTMGIGDAVLPAPTR